MNVQNFGKLPIKTVLVFLKSCHSFDMAIRKKQIQRSSSLRPNIKQKVQMRIALTSSTWKTLKQGACED